MAITKGLCCEPLSISFLMVSMVLSFFPGALAAPTLADIDEDGNLEVVLNTAGSGLVAYRLPNTANVRVLWNTGRGNYLRNGTP